MEDAQGFKGRRWDEETEVKILIELQVRKNELPILKRVAHGAWLGDGSHIGKKRVVEGTALLLPYNAHVISSPPNFDD